MALSFPLAFNDFMALIGLEDGTFTLQRNDQVSGLGNGQPLNAELASPLWKFDGQTIAMKNDDAEALAAIFELLEAPGRDFYVANPRKMAPREDKNLGKLNFTDYLHTSKPWGDGLIWNDAMPWGGAFPPPSAVQVSSIGSNNREVALKGLPEGYVLSRGDMLAIEYGPGGQKRRDIFRIVSETVTAGSNGVTGLIELSTFIRAGVVANDAVYLGPATMRAKLIPKSYRPVQVGPLHQRFVFSAIQKLV